MKLIALILTLALAAVVVSGCGAEEYEDRFEKADLPVAKRSDCKPAYIIEHVNDDKADTKVCTFVSPKGEACTYYYARHTSDIDCTAPGSHRPETEPTEESS